MASPTIHGPHQGQPVLVAGEPLDHAQAAMIMVHGRGATADSILTLADELAQPGFVYLAPQAAGDTLCNSFGPYQLARISSAGRLAGRLTIWPGPAFLLSDHRWVFAGGMLSLEFDPARQRYGSVAGLSSGLIGPDGTPITIPVRWRHACLPGLLQ
jgi:hypothetical protein